MLNIKINYLPSFRCIPILLFLLFNFNCSPESTSNDNPGKDTNTVDNSGNISTANGEKETHHPFLIVSKELFASLREKSNTDPWKSMKEDAISRVTQAPGSNNYGSLQKYVGAAALAYILDDGKSEEYAQKVKDVILNRYSTLDIEESSSWSKVVPTMGAFFCAILALDIVYDALSLEDIKKCEELISERISRVSRTGSWKTARYGTHGTWDIYKGDRVSQDDNYFNALINQITPDGVSPVTNTYAWSRVGGGDSRISKSGYMDVLEFTGIDKRYYNNERLQKFMRWQFGSSINPAKELAIFGDMLPTETIGNSLLYRRVVNFDEAAATYAAWYLDGIPADGHILTYIVPKKELPDPFLPSSQIYENGGAFFRDKQDSASGLHAVLYNIRSQNEWHTHNEVNGLSLSGLGNRLLVNGGRLGAPTRAAKLNNTLTINGENHDGFTGAGIAEGITADGLDYAKGEDGNAIRFKDHSRSLILIQTTPDTNGYFVVLDQVKTDPGDNLNNHLHPASQNNIITTENLREYTAPIDHYPSAAAGKVTFYYISAPDAVKIEKSPSAVQDRYPGYPDHNRLTSIYSVDSEGEKSIATLIFPHNHLVSKPNFEKFSSNQFEGVKFSQGTFTDYLISTNNKLVEFDNSSFMGHYCWAREKDKVVSSFFVKSGTSFLNNGFGFESDSPLTIYVKGSKGIVISEGSTLKLKGSSFSGVKFDKNINIKSTSDGFIEVELPKGKFKFQ
tara:strand:+ start:111843 stop:114044 length:2202 start_codon:yes stop_codon:yes gene_type:complete